MQQIAALFIVFAVLSSACAKELRLEVRAGGHDRENCPALFPVPIEMADTKSFSLVRESDGKQIAIQRFGPTKARKLMWIIHDRLEAGDKRYYKLVGHETWQRQHKSVHCDNENGKLTISVDGTPVLKFNYAMVEAPEGIDSVYRRSGYFHPVMTPNGSVVTGDFEKDHPHQHGLFNAWVDTTFRERPTDFWNQAKGRGDVEFTGLKHRQVSGSVFAQFAAKLTHVAIIEGDRVPAMEENILVRVFNTKPFLFEIVSRQALTSDDPVHVNEYHYGGFGIRGPSAWLIEKNESKTKPNEDPPAAGGFLTSEHRTREDGNHTRARWVEMHGPVGSSHAGIIVLSAPNNFRAPQTVRLHPTKPYFCFAPMVLGKFTLEPGDSYVSRFRYVVHDGRVDPELAERSWQDLAHPVKVSVAEKIRE